MNDERLSRRRGQTYPLPLPADIPEGRTTPWIAAMERTGRDPYHPVLGTALSAYPPDADAMEGWLRTDSATWDVYCDLADAIDAGTIECIRVRNGDGSVDLLASLIRIVDADEIADRRNAAPPVIARHITAASDKEERALAIATPDQLRQTIGGVVGWWGERDEGYGPNVNKCRDLVAKVLARSGLTAKRDTIVQSIADKQYLRRTRGVRRKGSEPDISTFPFSGN